MTKLKTEFEKVHNEGFSASLVALRNRAFDAFQSLEFPTTREEDWRFTNIVPYFKEPYRNLIEAAPAAAPSDLARGFTGLQRGSIQIVFVNGRFVPELFAPPKEYYVGTLRDSKTDLPWEDYLGKIVPYDRNAFTAWNTAFFDDAILVHVPKGVIVTEPLQLSFVNTGIANAAGFPRVLILLGKDSQLPLLETYTSSNGKGRSLTNAVMEIVLEEGAILQHTKVQRENPAGVHIAASHVVQKTNSSYSSVVLSAGAELSREHLRVTIDGTGGDCTLNGIYLIGENQHADHHTTIDHARPHGTSRELYKGILSGKSRAVFNGKIIVRKDAQKTDAEQVNRNLLLSDAARINTTPQLEILADDVKCRHGATIGHLDDDALFYMRSRGISDSSARLMLMKAFLQEVTGRSPEGKIRQFLDEIVISRLSQFTGAQL